ncbi:MAG TPA: DinB family protein [Candidatus Dormibacteraeota bacterium]|jgi:uncharacterized damage-inducible protein DinB|nr:DinB family protein [Candidatus Dormibacteraeota bacterium]
MSIAEMLLPEFDTELANTRKTLERVPADKWDWKPHEKSGTLGWLAGHVASLPHFTITTIQTPKLEIEGSTFPSVKTHADLLPTLDSMAKEARTALAGVTDTQMKEIWTLTWKGDVIFSMPRYEVLRVSCFNHIVHHRAQLTMYLRLLNVPIPGLYGPSADEQ